VRTVKPVRLNWKASITQREVVGLYADGNPLWNAEIYNALEVEEWLKYCKQRMLVWLTETKRATERATNVKNPGEAIKKSIAPSWIHKASIRTIRLIREL